MLSSVSAGYCITPNATEYEFDVNASSPIGTVVFEVLLIIENIIDFNFTIVANLTGQGSSPYSINGMDVVVVLHPPFRTNPLLMIALDEALDPNDDQVDYLFRIDYFAFSSVVKTGMMNVTLHEIGKIYYSYLASHM